MVDERTAYWGERDAARYRTRDDDPTGGDYVVAETLDANGDPVNVLLRWDDTAGEWVSGGPVNMDGNDLTNVGALDADSVSTGEATIDGKTGVGVGESSPGPTSFGTWYQASETRPAIIQVESFAYTDGTTDGIIQIEVDESGGTEVDYTLSLTYCDADTSSSETFEQHVSDILLPAGAQYKFFNNNDPAASNGIPINRVFIL